MRIVRAEDLYHRPLKVLPRHLRLEIGAMIITPVKLVRPAVWVSMLSVAIGGICEAQTGTSTPPKPPTNTPTVQATVGTTTASPPVTQSGPSLPPSIGSGGKVMTTGSTVTTGTTSMTITGTGNADPFILFDLHAVNPTDSAVKFTFFFDIPLVTPFTTSDLLRTQLDITVFHGSIAPTTLPDSDGRFIPIFQTFLGNAGDEGWTHQTLLDLGTEVLFASKLYDSGSQFAVPPNPITIFNEGEDNGQHKDEGKHKGEDPKNGEDPISAWVQFDLAPHSDIDVVGNINFPEPSSLICWAGLGVAFVGAHYWRRRRVAA
jgi:hypothetical protein